MKQQLKTASKTSETFALPASIPNPSLRTIFKEEATNLGSHHSNGNAQMHPSVPIGHRYYTNLETFQAPPEISEYNLSFTKTIEAIKRRHDPVVTTVAQGILEYKERLNGNVIDTQVQQFLDRFYMSRIGIRMLIGQHSALYRSQSHGKDYVGVICTRTNIKEIALDAIANARFICEEHYGLFKAPEVQMFCPADIEFMYVPSHLNHMLFELLKNSLRAVVERFGPDYEMNSRLSRLLLLMAEKISRSRSPMKAAVSLDLVSLWFGRIW